MGLRVLLLAETEATRAHYATLAAHLGTDVEMAESADDLVGRLTNTPCSGLLIDSAAISKVPGGDDIGLRDVMEAFPVFRLNWTPASPAAPGFDSDKELQSLEYFLGRTCPAFDARTLRLYDRYRANFNVLLTRDIESSSSVAVRTVTMNVSEGGCFLFYSDEWKLRDNIWFTVQELDDKRPIGGEIRWKIDWGRIMRCPGFGIRYVDIREEQVDQLVSLARALQGARSS